MKSKFILVLLSGLLLSTPALFAEVIDLESEITGVVVFLIALITRQAEVELPAGTHSLRVGPLPGRVEQNSINAKGEGSSEVKLFGAALEIEQLEKEQPPKVRELEGKIYELETSKKEIENQKSVLKSKKKFLESIKAATAEQIGKDIVTRVPSVTDVAGLVDYLEKELTLVYKGFQSQEEGIREINLQIDRLRRELRQLIGSRGKQEAVIVVDVEAASNGKFLLEVSYRIPGASWHPVYEARVDSKASNVEMIGYGVVRQNTGEDWKDVSLTLSTARPSVGGRMPEIEPWFLKKWEPPIVLKRSRGYSKRKHEAPMAMALMESADMEVGYDEDKMDLAAAVPVSRAEVAQASIEVKGPSVHYKLPKLETIESNWESHKVSVLSQRLDVRLAYEVTPRLAPYAYLHAKVKNGSEGVLLPGQVQVFSDGAYIGASSVDLIGPEGEFDLYLGVDEQIKIERKQLKAKEDVSILPTMHGRIKTIEYVYLTTFENLSSKSVELSIIDQVPVSQHDEIKIEQVQFDPGPVKAEKDKPGVHRWKMTVAPGKKGKIKISYRVKHPVDFNVGGL